MRTLAISCAAVFIMAVVAVTNAKEAERPATRAELAHFTETVKDRARDPDSVKVRNVQYVAEHSKNGYITRIFCGEVNAKNAYGGYTGFRPLVAWLAPKGAHSEAVFEDESHSVAKVCRALRKGTCDGTNAGACLAAES